MYVSIRQERWILAKLLVIRDISMNITWIFILETINYSDKLSTTYLFIAGFGVDHLPLTLC